MNKKDLLLNAIQEMLNGNIDETNAICENLDILTDNGTAYFCVSKFSETWEHYSGDKHYPVSGEEVWDRGIFDDSLFWWTGEQLELRMSLLKHLKCEVLKLSDEEFEEMFK